jgi:energy-coupling factor transporter ATP-binding protein EcfA2
MAGRKSSALRLVLATLCVVILLPVATNLATGVAPSFLTRNPWVSWAGVVLFGGVAVWETTRQLRPDLVSRRPPLRPGDRAKARTQIAFYLKARLDQSLAGAVHADVEVRPILKAVTTLPGTHVGPPDVAWSLRADATALEAFDAFEGSLLILGDPGAGKTTLLLELATALLERSQSEGPLPVLLELAAWRPDKPADVDVDGFVEWITERIQDVYSIGSELAAAWFEDRGLVLLLDGLDEVADSHSESCLRLINLLQERLPRLAIAVTSRTDPYRRTTALLELRGAISIQPLSDQQILEYLSDPRLQHMREAVRADPGLLELLKAPLWISVMRIAYEKREASVQGDLEQRRNQLLDGYVASLLGRRTLQHQPARIVQWLARIAHVLQSGQFPVLPQKGYRTDELWVRVIPANQRGYLIRLVMPIITVLAGLPLLAIVDRTAGLLGAFLAALIFVWGITWPDIRPRPIVVTPSSPYRAGLLPCWSWAALILLGTALGIAVFEGAAELSTGMTPGARTIIIVSVIVVSQLYDLAKALTTPTPHLTHLLPGKRRIIAQTWLLRAVVVALPVLLWVLPASTATFRAFLEGLLLAGVAQLLLASTARALRVRGRVTRVPMALAGLVYLLGAAWLLAAWLFGWNSNALSAVRAPVVVFTTALLVLPGFTWLSKAWNHRVSACLMALLGVIPWRLGRFLDHATDLGLMQHARDGYRFPHLLITEHFASKS